MMKVLLDVTGTLRGLVNVLESQGDEVVQQTDDQTLVLQEPITVEPMLVGMKCEKDGYVTHTATRFFSEGVFLPQTLVGFPITGMMNEDKGAMVPTGFVGRFVSDRLFIDEFENPGLVAFFNTMEHHGLVSVLYHWEHVVGVQTWIPSWGLYALLECVQGKKISDWLKEPTRLWESWCASCLVSRFPYPESLTSAPVAIEGLGPISKNLWMLGGSENRGVWVTSRNELCVVSGQFAGVYDLCRGVQRVCDQIKVPEVQYRSDLGEVGRERWNQLREKGIV